jgi:hypothetical protein
MCGLSFVVTDVKTNDIYGSLSVQYGINITNKKKVLESMERFKVRQTSVDVLMECNAC